MSYNPSQPPTYGQPPPSYEQYGEPQTLYGQAAQPYAQPPYNVPPVAGYAPPQPKKSRRRLWITLGIVFAVLILAFAGGIVAFIAVFNSVTAPARTVVEQYYDAVKSQNYAQAYSYLDIQTITINGQEQQATQALYTQVAQAIDQHYGNVTNYTITSVEVNSSNGLNTAAITVNVIRSKYIQEVHVQLRQEGNDWKIIGIDHF